MTKAIVLVLLAASLNVHASTDKLAHFGVSFALNTAMYGFYSKMFGMKKDQAVLFAALTTLTLGFAKEAGDAVERDGKFDYKDMLANTAGVGSSAGFIFVFDF